MQLTTREIEHLAKLSAIELDAATLASTQQGLTDMLSLLEQLKQIDVGDTQPLAHPLEILHVFPQPLRDDWVHNITPDQQAQAVAIAPMVESGLYIVPKVIE